MSNLKLPKHTDKISYFDSLELALLNKSLICEFDRLYGCNLSMKGSPIELMVDKNSGRTDSDFKLFIEFFDEFIWSRLAAPNNRR